MNYGPLLFLGIFFALCLSWYGMIVGPILQIGRKEPVTLEPSGQVYPTHRAGLAQQGREIYRANGCYYCHTQGVRHTNEVDIARGWGERMSVAQDYLYDNPVMVGNIRLGPDLTNVGLRQTNEMWHLMHLYDPKLTVQGSIMPAYPYLFEKRKIAGRLSPDALPAGIKGVEEGYEIVPKPEAKALAAYLLSLSTTQPLFEAPVPQPEKPESQSDTNQPATNAAISLSAPLVVAESVKR